MERLKGILDKSLGVICEVMFCFMTVIAVYQVVTRYIFNSPSSFSEELLTYSFAWVAMLATVLVFGERDHMRLAFFADRFQGRTAVLLMLLTECLTLVFAGLVLIYGGISIVKLTLRQVTASLGIPMGYVYMIMPISGILTAVYNVIHIRELFRQLQEGQPDGQKGGSI